MFVFKRKKWDSRGCLPQNVPRPAQPAVPPMAGHHQNLRRSAMRRAFGHSLDEIAAASLFSCFIAVGICALTNPGATNNAAAPTNSVNRVLKGDRLPPASVVQRSERNSTSTENAPSRKHTLLGCESAFSPVADPARTHYLVRCMT